MKIIVVYVFPVAPHYFDNAVRFVMTYNQHPPGIEHRLIIASNGGPPTDEMKAVIGLLNHPGPEVFIHDNTGYDIGAEQAAARTFPCDMMVFFGASGYLRGPNWLKRMADAFERHGPTALYGTTANNGDMGVGVYPHIRTTGYFLAPLMFNMYPLKVTRPEHRYPAEHGPNCLTEWFRKSGHKALMVTWHHEYEWPFWASIYNGFQHGDQSELLCGDRMTDPPFYPY